MVVKGTAGNWYGIGQIVGDKDDDTEYVVVEIWDEDDTFMIRTLGKSLWLSKKEFEEVFAKIYEW